MQAIRVHETGDASVLQYETNVPEPTVSSGKQVKVKIAFAGINFIDTYHRSGLYKLPLPLILGREASGVVAEVGSEVSNVKVGDRVAFMNSGTYAEYNVTDQSNIVPVPSNVSLRDAAAVILQGLTAHYLISTTYPLTSKHTILVHAAAGGTGAIIVQMAKIKGATVIATAGSDDKCSEAKSLGADHVINYQKDDFLAEVKRITNNKGVNVVYDGVGKATWEKSLQSLSRLGYLVLFGNASGAVPPIDPLSLSKHGSLFVTRPTLNDYIAEPGSLQQRMDELLHWIGSGKVKVRVGKSFALKDAAEAHRYLESRQSTGKLLLNVHEELDSK